MPIYIFANPDNHFETIELIQDMNDIHEYYRDGKKWDRVFTKPQASFDTAIDPFNSNDFVEKTRNKRGSLGDLWDKSSELSEKRAKIGGKDAILEKSHKDYQKTRRGKIHPDVRKARAVEKLNKMGVDVEN